MSCHVCSSCPRTFRKLKTLQLHVREDHENAGDEDDIEDTQNDGNNYNSKNNCDDRKVNQGEIEDSIKETSETENNFTEIGDRSKNKMKSDQDQMDTITVEITPMNTEENTEEEATHEANTESDNQESGQIVDGGDVEEKEENESQTEENFQNVPFSLI